MGIYKIGNICKLEKGRQIDTALLSDDNKYKYINGGVTASGYYTDFNTSGCVVTVSEGGASCGFVNYIEEPFWCGCHCYRLTDIQFPPKYIYYALKANQDRIMALRTGSAMPNIKKSSFAQLEIQLSEKTERQEQVIAVLGHIDNLISKRQTQCELLDKLVKARFVEMFGDPVHNDHRLPTKKLNELGSIDRGRSKHRPRNAPELLNGPYPLIQTGEVASAGLYITEYQNTYSEIGLQQSKMWKAGTLCITIAANIAQTAILTFDACFPDSVVGFVPNDDVDVIYMHYWFSFFQKILERQPYIKNDVLQ